MKILLSLLLISLFTYNNLGAVVACYRAGGSVHCTNANACPEPGTGDVEIVCCPCETINNPERLKKKYLLFASKMKLDSTLNYQVKKSFDIINKGIEIISESFFEKKEGNDILNLTYEINDYTSRLQSAIQDSDTTKLKDILDIAKNIEISISNLRKSNFKIEKKSKMNITNYLSYINFILILFLGFILYKKRN